MVQRPRYVFSDCSAGAARFTLTPLFCLIEMIPRIRQLSSVNFPGQNWLVGLGLI